MFVSEFNFWCQKTDLYEVNRLPDVPHFSKMSLQLKDYQQQSRILDS